MEQSQLDELIKVKKRNKILTIVIAILLIILIYNVGMSYVQDFISSKDTVSETEPVATETSSQIKDGLLAFFESIYNLNYGLPIKILICLGAIYLIQICFTLVFDILEVIVLIGLVFYKLFTAIKNLFKKKK